MMMAMLQLLYAETRREVYRIRTYFLDFFFAQLLFVLGFLLLSGLFQLISDGAFTGTARLVSLVGFFTWQVADGCMVRTAQSFSEDAQWEPWNRYGWAGYHQQL